MAALQDDKSEHVTWRRSELLARIVLLLEQLPDEEVEKLTETWILEIQSMEEHDMLDITMQPYLKIGKN